MRSLDHRAVLIFQATICITYTQNIFLDLLCFIQVYVHYCTARHVIAAVVLAVTYLLTAKLQLQAAAVAVYLYGYTRICPEFQINIFLMVILYCCISIIICNLFYVCIYSNNCPEKEKYCFTAQLSLRKSLKQIIHSD